ncbi:hypothetical protein [Streptomyces sp. NPDC047108]|uniref:hypothetical protein n=1 Tax=Streptomyces sp. NPDC047108 TaxID=3155025 RepID=UPI0033E774F7
MSRSTNRPLRRAALALPALTAAVLLAGCGGGERSGSGAEDAPSSPASSATAPAGDDGDAADLSRMQKLVDDAESAVGKADSDAATDD